MKAKVLNELPERAIALVFQEGDEVVSLLNAFVREHEQTAARFTAIGALSDVTLGYFDWKRKDYLRIRIAEQVEVLALTGDVALDGREPKIHAHVVVGKRDGTAHGGHLLEAQVRPTLEMVLVESPAFLRRRFDQRSGIALIDIGA